MRSDSIACRVLLASTCLLLSAVGNLHAAPDQAADNDDHKGSLQEVVVSAQKRSERLQDVPIAITALTADDLADRRIVGFENVAEVTPSITVAPYSNSTTAFFVYMRGLGFIDPGQIAADGSVGVYEDGFYVSRPQAMTLNLSDLDRVEVLRGPQGTLYGRNTTGGAINFVSKAPSGEFHLKQALDFGNLNSLRSFTSIDLPELNHISAKISLLASSQDGFVKNRGSSHDYGERKERGGKIQLRWAPIEGFRADYFADLGRLWSTPQYTVNPSFNGMEIYPGIPYFGTDERPSHTYRPIDLPLSDARSEFHGLTLSWTPSDSFAVKSLTGYRSLTDNAFQNYNEAFGIPDYQSETRIHGDQLSQEIQLIGDLANGNLRYVAGLYLFDEEARREDYKKIPSYGFNSFEYDYAKTRSQAIYGQVTWKMLRDLELTIGGRYTWDKKDARRTLGDNFSGTIEDNSRSSLEYSRFNPTAIIAYSASDDLNFYLKYATAYKSGAANSLASPGRFGQAFGPENIAVWEGGMKSRWWEQKLQINAAVFRTLYRDRQGTFLVAPFVFYYDAFNVGKTTINGLELDLAWVPTDWARFGVNYTFMDGKVKELAVPAGTIFDPAINPLSPYQIGDDISSLFVYGNGYASDNSVDSTATFTLRHTEASDLTLHVDYRWQSRRLLRGSGLPGYELVAVPSYGELGAHLTFATQMGRGEGQLRSTIWAKNLTNIRKPSTVDANGTLVPIPGIPEAGYTSAYYYSWVEPRTFGISFAYEY